MKPIKSNVLVALEAEKVKEGNIPKGNSTMYGEVVDFGSDIGFLKKGDRIAFHPFGIAEVDVAGKTLLVVGEELILGVYGKSATKTKK